MFLNGGGQEIGSPGEYGAGRERAGRRGKKEREVEVLKKGGKWEKLRNNTLVFRSQKGKRGEAKKKLASAGKANMESKIFRSFLYGYTRNILYCHLLYPFQIFSSFPFVAVDLYRSKPLISLVRFNLHFHCFQR